MANTPQQNITAVRGSIRLGIAASFLCFGAWSTSAKAQDDAADVAAARELAVEGLKLAEAGRCAPAIDKLSRAEKLHHAPIVLGRLGECLISEGSIVEGTEALRRVLREPVPADAPPTLTKARERAQAALDAAKPKIASLVISIREPPEGVAVTVDGQAVSSALFDRSRPTDPGEHQIEVSAPGFLKVTRQVDLGPGEKQEVAVRLNPDPQAVVTKTPAPASNTGPAPSERTTRHATTSSGRWQPSRDDPHVATDSPSRAPSYVLWSVGAAAGVVGGIFGYRAVKAKGDLDEQCVNGLCPQSSKSNLDGAKRDALVSTILVGAGVTALAAGTVLYLVSGPSSSVESISSVKANIQPVVGLGSIGLTGKF